MTSVNTAPLRLLLVVSATVAGDRPPDSAPRRDYEVLAQRVNATVLDRSQIRTSRSARVVARLFGYPLAQAWVAFRRRRAFDAILTDGEHIGIPLALLLKLARDRTAHVTIGHRLTAAKKRPFFRWLRVQTHVTRFALHARRQYDLATQRLSIPAEQLALLPYQVDTAFWQPQAVPEERLICSAGLEFRDYPTLVRAVHDLNVQVVIGAASHWSKRRNSAKDAKYSPSIKVGAFDYAALRALYARSAIVVVPLDDTDFQAGVTTILEAMAMGKPVIVTHSQGQTDVVEDRRRITRGAVPRARPTSFLRTLAIEAGLDMEPTGFYVPPNDPSALRNAIVYLLDHPQARRQLGAAGRRVVQELLTVEQFGERLAALLVEARTAIAVQQARQPERDMRPSRA